MDNVLPCFKRLYDEKFEILVDRTMAWCRSFPDWKMCSTRSQGESGRAHRLGRTRRRRGSRAACKGYRGRRGRGGRYWSARPKHVLQNECTAIGSVLPKEEKIRWEVLFFLQPNFSPRGGRTIADSERTLLVLFRPARPQRASIRRLAIANASA